MINCEVEEDEESLAKRQELGKVMRSSFETVLEWIAAADLYTDILVLSQL